MSSSLEDEGKSRLGLQRIVLSSEGDKKLTIHIPPKFRFWHINIFSATIFLPFNSSMLLLYRKIEVLTPD